MSKVGNKIKIPCKGTFFRWWFEFLKPVHHLTDRECDVAAAIVAQRYILSKSILDPVLLDKVLMNEDSKREIRKRANVTLAHFQVIMGKLKQNGIIKNGALNLRYVPNLDENGTDFKLLTVFDFGEEIVANIDASV